jgi:hypothetical protein
MPNSIFATAQVASGPDTTAEVQGRSAERSGGLGGCGQSPRAPRQPGLAIAAVGAQQELWGEQRNLGRARGFAVAA